MFVWVINSVTKDSFRETNMHKIRLILQNSKICCVCGGCKHTKRCVGVFPSVLWQPASACFSLLLLPQEGKHWLPGQCWVLWMSCHASSWSTVKQESLEVRGKRHLIHKQKEFWEYWPKMPCLATLHTEARWWGADPNELAIWYPQHAAAGRKGCCFPAVLWPNNQQQWQTGKWPYSFGKSLSMYTYVCSLTHPLSEWEIRAFLTWGSTRQMLSSQQDRCCQRDKRGNHINT